MDLDDKKNMQHFAYILPQMLFLSIGIYGQQFEVYNYQKSLLIEAKSYIVTAILHRISEVRMGIEEKYIAAQALLVAAAVPPVEPLTT